LPRAAAVCVPSAGANMPRSSDEFMREWRRGCPTAADKYRCACRTMT
jgi:hypothetical protein